MSCVGHACRDDGSYGPIPSRRPLGMLGMPFNRTSVQVLAPCSAYAVLAATVLALNLESSFDCVCMNKDCELADVVQ